MGKGQVGGAGGGKVRDPIPCVYGYGIILPQILGSQPLNKQPCCTAPPTTKKTSKCGTRSPRSISPDRARGDAGWLLKRCWQHQPWRCPRRFAESAAARRLRPFLGSVEVARQAARGMSSKAAGGGRTEARGGLRKIAGPLCRRPVIVPTSPSYALK